MDRLAGVVYERPSTGNLVLKKRTAPTKPKPKLRPKRLTAADLDRLVLIDPADTGNRDLK